MEENLPDRNFFPQKFASFISDMGDVRGALVARLSMTRKRFEFVQGRHLIVFNIFHRRINFFRGTFS
jgi:hypothetical protein